MDEEEEWLASVVSTKTKENYRRGFRRFKEWIGLTPHEILELRRKEGKRFTSRIVSFFNHRRTQVSENSARTEVVPVQSFLTFWDLSLKLRMLPQIGMKLETYVPTVADLQKVYKLNGLEVKAWLSLSRDCPARIGDMLDFSPDQIASKEFMIRSKKEKIVGKVYISDNTVELWTKNPKVPTFQQGIDKMWKRACEIAGIPSINQHLLRKFWISTATNLQLNEKIIKILAFKKVPQSDLTYFLNRLELRESWKRVIEAIPLEGKATDISDLEKRLDKHAKFIRKIVQMQQALNGRPEVLKGMDSMTEDEMIDTFLGSEALEIVKKRKKD